MRQVTFRTLAGCVNNEGGSWHAGNAVYFVDREGELSRDKKLTIVVNGEVYGSVSVKHEDVFTTAYKAIFEGKSIGVRIAYVLRNLDDWLDW